MSLKIRRVQNFRDLGGLPAKDGRVIAFRKLYRSAHHGNLRKKTGERIFPKLGIRYVVDLRSDSEIFERPDTHVDGTGYFHFPPLDDKMNPAVNRRNRMGILKHLMQHENGTRGHLCDVYRHMMTNKASLEAFSHFLHLLIKEPEGGFIWHCTQGKDRAGMGTAVLLMALGVERNVIERDYMRSNRSTWVKNHAVFLLVAVFKHSLHMAKSLLDLMSARLDYLQAAFDTVDTVYGGTDKFLHSALGLTDSDIASLRNAYLVSET